MAKTIVISGGSKGIGRAIALKFGKQGFNVAVCSRSEANLNSLKPEFSDFSGRLVTIACDVSNKKDVNQFAQSVIKEFGSVDVLVNNAGVFLPGQVINETEGTLEKLIETNLYSAYYLTRALIPIMIKSKNGHIFNISSVAGTKAYPNGGSYSISKFALIGFSKALREELMPYNIAVSTLLPGATLTDSWKGTDLPESRFMKSEDLADLVWGIQNLSANTVVEEVLLRPMEGDI